MSVVPCRICDAPTRVLFQAFGERALISSGKAIPGHTHVDVCDACGHAQTRPIVDLGQYYADHYQFKMSSQDEDDLYERRGDTDIFRSDHQSAIVGTTLSLVPGMRILDYGCGKSMTLRSVTRRTAGLEPYVFDVSDAYRATWDEFVAKDHQASFALPSSWQGTMDVVLSFFALEHVEEPHAFLDTICSVLRPGGKVLIIVPNVVKNISDLVVVDHVNHFSPMSLRLLLSRRGFIDMQIDETSFRGAFVVTAQWDRSGGAGTGDAALLEGVAAHVATLESSARSLLDGVKTMNAISTNDLTSADKVMIYGSGIYGLFIFHHLQNLERFAGFLDQSPFRQGLELYGYKVFSPAAIPADVKTVFVGLNPSIAERVIEHTYAQQDGSRKFVYFA